MLEQVLRYLKNWFLTSDGVHAGQFVVENGGIALPFLQPGQYFRIIGSVFNDGVYKYPTEKLTDEAFNGYVWSMAIPPSLLQTVAAMEKWQDKFGESAAGLYQSESFGGYSYTKATDAATGGAMSVFAAFDKQLAQWRKI